MGWQWKTEWFDSIQMGRSFMAYGMLGVLMPVLAEVQLEPMPLSYVFFFGFSCMSQHILRLVDHNTPKDFPQSCNTTFNSYNHS